MNGCSQITSVTLAVVLLILPLSGAEELPASVDAGPGEADLAAYLERALTANPELSAVRHRYEAALQRVPQARSLPDPRLQVTHFVESVQTRTGPQEQVLALSQQIPWFGTRSARAEAAAATAEALWFAVRARELELAEAVAKAYFEYGYTGRAIRLTETNRDLLDELEPIVEERVRGGGELNALLRLQVERGRIGDRLASLEAERISQSARLAALLAWPSHELLPLPSWEAPVASRSRDAVALQEALRERNPTLARLRREVASAAARREVARLGAYPDFSLGLNYIRLGSPDMSGVTDAGTDPWGLTVAVNLPLWRGRVEAEKEEAHALQRAAEAFLASRLNELEADLSATLARLHDAERRLELYGGELLGLARQALENSRSAYETGRSGLLEVIDSERSLLELELLHWRAAADAWQARYALRALLDEPFDAAPSPAS